MAAASGESAIAIEAKVSAQLVVPSEHSVPLLTVTDGEYIATETLDGDIVMITATPKVAESEPLDRGKVVKVAYLAAVYAILWSAFNPVQSMAQWLFPSVGFVAMSVVYLLGGLGSLVAPIVVNKVGSRFAVVGGSVTFALWLAAAALQSPALFIVCSIVIGFGQAVIWNAQAMYVNEVADGKATGRFTGIFFGIFFFCAVGGQALSAVFLPAVGAGGVAWIMFGLAVVGVVMAFFVRPASSHPLPKPEHPPGFREELLRPLRFLVAEKDIRYLYVYMVFQGLTVAYANGSFPPLMELELVPIAFLFYGATLIGGSFVLGTVYDRWGWKALLVLNLGLCLVAYSLLLAAWSSQTAWLFIVGGFFLGFIETLSNTLMSASLMKLFGHLEDPASAFAVWRLFTALSSSLGFFLSGLVVFWAVELLLLLLFAVGGALCWVKFSQFHHASTRSRAHGT